MAATTGTVFTRRIHQCASSVRERKTCPMNCGSNSQSIRRNGRSFKTDAEIQDRQNELMGNLDQLHEQSWISF